MRGELIRLFSLAVAAVILASCGTATPGRARGRVAVSQYNGWTIGVTPSSSDSRAWSARVQVWPRDVNPQTHGGIVLAFTEYASTETAIVVAGDKFARRYIDASTFERDPDTDVGARREAPPGFAVIDTHNGWTMRITPSATSADAHAWRAGVEVWPPDRSPESYSGIQIGFTDVAPDERSIVESAMRSARRYIDASQTRH